ncbi:hypothetical protein ACEPAH_427 [Sanghuangporus vaninii]
MASAEDTDHDVGLSTKETSKSSSGTRRFSIDEAFSDGGDDEFDFSSEAIRRELARSSQTVHSVSDDADAHCEDIQTQPSYDDPDASVSTFDINASAAPTPDRTSVSSPRSLDSHEPGSPQHDVSADGVHTSPKDEMNGPTEGVHHSFPSVVIDLSKDTATQVTILPSVDSETSQVRSGTSMDSVAAVSDASGHSKNGSVPAAALSTSQSLPVAATATRPPTHRPTKSTGPSALEKVVSKTRPTFLPPKAKDEDLRHYADWETMMKQSKAAEEKKQKLRQERRLAREHAVEESISIWEHQIIPDWKNAVRDPKLRKIWWNGIPPKLRGIVWEKTVGNGLALSKDTYRTCFARASRALAAGTFPTTTLNLIDADIRSTLPTLHIFTPNAGPMYQDLLDLLCAWVVSRSDEGLGYVMGASKIAAMLLLNMQPPSAFVTMRNLLERHCMRSFYGGMACKEDIDAYYRIFDTLLADCMPKVYFNFKQHQISPAAYFPEWIIPLFLDHLPLEACARIWDVLVLEGDSFLFRAALGILASLEARLFFPERKELLSLLSGENKAALEVARRDGTLIGDCKYEIYGLDEEHVWERIEGLEGWWKDSTWSRLLTRELPDL